MGPGGAAGPKDWPNSLHVNLQVEKGMNFVENLNLQELSQDKVYAFLFICLPLLLKGATGSWVRPVAIV